MFILPIYAAADDAHKTNGSAKTGAGGDDAEVK